jgi:methyl-accepting chemotaxis protein
VLLENHAEAVETVAADFEEGADAYDDFAGDYLAALEEQVDLLVEAHEEFETQSVDAVDQVATGLEDVQDQLEDVQAQVQEQVRDVQQQAAEAVEA